MKKVFVVFAVLLMLLPVNIHADNFQDYRIALTDFFIVWANANKGIVFDDYADTFDFVVAHLDPYIRSYGYEEDYLQNLVENTGTLFTDESQLVFTPELLKFYRYLFRQLSDNILYENRHYELPIAQPVITGLVPLLSDAVMRPYGTAAYRRYFQADNTFYLDIPTSQKTAGGTRKTAGCSQVNSNNRCIFNFVPYDMQIPAVGYYGDISDLGTITVSKNIASCNSGDACPNIWTYIFPKNNEAAVEAYSNLIVLLTSENTLRISGNCLDSSCSLYPYRSYRKTTESSFSGDYYFVSFGTSNIMYVDLPHLQSGVDYSGSNLYLMWHYTSGNYYEYTNVPMQAGVWFRSDSYKINGVELFNPVQEYFIFDTGTFLPALTQNDYYYQIVHDLPSVGVNALLDYIENDLTRSYFVKIYDEYTNMEYGTDDQLVLSNAMYNLLHDETIESPENDLNSLIDEEHQIHDITDQYTPVIDEFFDHLDSNLPQNKPLFLSTLQWTSDIASQLMNIHPVFFFLIITALTFIVLRIFLR